MNKNDWVKRALSSLEFFVSNPEYKGEFGHQYFVDNLNVSRATLNRNKKYMKRFREVKEYLKSFKAGDPELGPASSTAELNRIQRQAKTIEEQSVKIQELQLRLNDCYQKLEDHGIDPEFIYPRRGKLHKEA